MYERQLKADTFKPHASDKDKDKKQTKKEDQKNDILDVNEASKFLRGTKILELLELLDSLVVVPTEGDQLESIFHS